jgi:hypothetical protein
MARRLVRAPQERAVLELAERVGTSERRIYGWEPTERHDHFDADGEFTGHTIITREPEWDDRTRDRHLALAEYHAGIHMGCGLHESIASDDPYFALEDTTCPVCAAIDLQMRVRGKQEHEREQEQSESAPRASDGRSTHVRLLRPEEIARLPAPAAKGR